MSWRNRGEGGGDEGGVGANQVFRRGLLLGGDTQALQRSRSRRREREREREKQEKQEQEVLAVVLVEDDCLFKSKQ